MFPEAVLSRSKLSEHVFRLRTDMLLQTGFARTGPLLSHTQRASPSLLPPHCGGWDPNNRRTLPTYLYCQPQLGPKLGKNPQIRGRYDGSTITANLSQDNMTERRQGSSTLLTKLRSGEGRDVAKQHELGHLNNRIPILLFPSRSKSSDNSDPKNFVARFEILQTITNYVYQKQLSSSTAGMNAAIPSSSSTVGMNAAIPSSSSTVGMNAAIAIKHVVPT